MRSLSLVLLVVLLAASATSCSRHEAAGPGGQAPVHVAFISNCVADYWLLAKAGTRQACKEVNAVCDYRMPAQATATNQKSLVEDVLANGAQGIAISPIDPKNQIDLLDGAAAKAKLVCTDSDAPKSKRTCYIGTNNVDAGLAAGEALKKILPNGGKVMIFVGNMDLQNGRERIRGVEEALANSNIHVLGIMMDDLDRMKCKANAEDALIKYKDLAGMVGIFGMNGPACADAVKAAGETGQVKIVCFDEEDDTLQGVQDGSIYATVVQDPYEMGYDSVKVLAALVRGQDPHIPKDGHLTTGITVVTRKNLDKFWTQLKERKRQS